MLTKSFLATLLLLSTSLLACAPSGPIVLEWHGSDEGLVMAQAAAAEWRDVCGAEISIDRDNDGKPTNEVPFNTLPDMYGVCYNDHDTHRPNLIEVEVYPGERTTLTHEFGHALGLAHATHGIMAPQSIRGTGPVHVTPQDCP